MLYIIMQNFKHWKKEYMKKNPPKDFTARRIEMAQLRYKNNLSLAAIGQRYGISRQRVHQILATIE